MKCFITEMLIVFLSALASVSTPSSVTPSSVAHTMSSTTAPAPTEVLMSQIAILDKNWTSTGSKNKAGSQALVTKQLASRVSFLAEGMGFEPTTPCGAPDFESGRWPVRLPS